MEFLRACLLLLFCNSLSAQTTMSIELNQQTVLQHNSIYLHTSDSLRLTADHPAHWYCYQPVLKAYDNLLTSTDHIEPIQYTQSHYHSPAQKAQSITLKKMKPGTYLFGLIKLHSSQLHTTDALHLKHEEIIQLVVRQSDDYLGYLTELLNLPFALPPKQLGHLGHQTDLHIATDCAELAIYGRRRMGDKIPYWGPKSLLKHLKPVRKAKPGDLLHFGGQVSVLYEDRGMIGQIDAADLLIHAYKTSVRIEPFADTDLYNRPFKVMRFRTDPDRESNKQAEDKD